MFHILTKMTKPKLQLALVLWCLTVCLTASAKNDQAAILLDTMVVTASQDNRHFQTGDVDLEQTTAFVNVIKRDEFEGRMDTLAEQIEKEAGIQVRQSGGLGSFSTVTLRGASSEQVMVYMDGMLLNDASGGGVNLSNISLSDVAAIEIYKGTTPVNFGKASIGGVVNIKTLRNEKGLLFNTGAGYGAFDTRNITGFMNHKPGKWDYLISAEYTDAENDFEFTHDNQTRFNPADDFKTRRNNAQFDQTNLLAKIGYDFQKDLRVDFLNRWFSKNQGLPSLQNSPHTSSFLDTRHYAASLKLTADHLGSLGINTCTQVNYSRKAEEYSDIQGHISLGNTHTRYVTTKYDGSFYAEWLTRSNTLSMNFDLAREGESLLNSDTDDSRRIAFNTGLQNTRLLFNGKAMVTATLRYARLSDRLQTNETLYANSPDQKISKSLDFVDPQVGVKINIFSWLTVKSNLARYHRAPSFFELFGNRGFFLGNMSLKPEEGTNFDIGMETNWLLKGLPADRLTLKATYFQSDVDHLIIRTYDSQGIGKSVNAAGSFISGFEFNAIAEALKYFTFSANATFQDTEHHSDNPAFDGKQLSGRYENAYMGRVTAKFAGFKLYTEYLIEEGMYYDTANLLPAKPKKELNAGCQWRRGPIQITFQLNNIKNTHNEDFNRYDLPGRSWYLNAKYTYQP